MRRMLAVVSAALAALTFALSGCGAAPVTDEENGAADDGGSVTLDGRYEITGEAELDGYNPDHIELVGDRLLIVGSLTETLYDDDGAYFGAKYDYRLFSADADTMETDSVPFAFTPEGYCAACAFDGEGNLLMVESVYKDRKNTLTLDFISADGQLVRSRSLDEVITTGFISCVCFESGMWYVSSGRNVVALDKDGEVTGKYDAGGDITEMFSAGGKIHACTADDHYILGPSGLTESPEWKKAGAESGGRGILTGGEYDYLKAEKEYICGYTLAGERTPLLNWLNSDISYSDTGDFVYGSDDVVYLILFGSFDGSGTRVVRMERKEGYTIPASDVITLYYGESGSRIVPIAAAGFNASQSEYRVVCHELSEGEDASAADGLNLRLVSGEAGDIIEIAPDADIRSFVDKGVFLDLYDLGIKKEELFSCVTELCETDGSLYAMPVSFTFQSLVGSTDFHPGGSGWTVDEFISEYKAAEENGGYLTSNDGRAAVLGYIRTGLMLSYIDFEKNVCSFDDPSFIEAAEWLKSLPESRTISGGMVRSAKDFIDGTVKLENRRFTMPQECLAAASLYGEFKTSGFVGYPTPDGGRARIICERYYGISSACKNPEAALSFLKYMLGGDALSPYYSMGSFGFPSLKAMLTAVMDRLGGYEYQIDPANLPSMTGSSAGIPESEKRDGMIYIKIDDDTTDYVVGFIEKIRPLPRLDSQLTEIFDEELSALLSGRSAADTAKNLQSRISLWLAERA